MSERKEKIKSKLITSHDYLNTVLDQVLARQEDQVYTDGLGWNVRQLAAHLADAEKGHFNQATSIADGKELIPADFDIERYNRRTTEKSAEKTFEQSRAEINEWRAKLMDWLEVVEDERLDYQGRHASLKIMSVYDILRTLSLHERAHADDMVRALDLKLP